MERILVVLANRENQNLLAQVLVPQYDVTFDVPTVASQAEASAEIDLCILDGSSLNKYVEELAAMRTREDPALLPVLLLSDRKAVGLMSKEQWRVVDDVALRPLDKREMRVRVETLVRARRLSVKLSRVSHLYKHEQRVAQRFQKAAMPRALPQVPGLVFSAFYRPGMDEAKIGGDWYDALQLPDSRILISIGDVCGSGLDAAVTMASVRQVIRGVAQIHPDPAMMLDAADRTLQAEDPNALVTAFVGVYDPITSILQFSSAGHPRPMLRFADGNTTELRSFGVPLGLGITAKEPRGVETVELPIDSLLVLYTDGLTEVTRDVIEGEKRLIAALADANVREAPNVALAIHDIVAGGEARDDVAVLAVGIVSRELDTDRLMHWSFDVTDQETASETKAEFLRELEVRGFSLEARQTAELVFGELIGNVYRYAPRWADITLDSSGEVPVLHVLDTGPGFAHAPRLPINPMSERGRGLFIVSTMTREFNVTQRPRGGSHARAVLDKVN